MSETVLIRSQADEDTVELKHEPYRPAKPTRRGPGYLLRQIAGVDETILDWVPEERHRYSRLGAIVLNTGLMAALSMLALLGSHDVPIAALVPAALLWGYVILTFDRWLITDTHGSSGMGTGKFLARLAISILMGLVVAEPLLLWMFSSDVHTQIGKDRTTLLDTYRSTLKRCNPLSGEPPADASGCTKEYVLNVPGSPRPLLDSKKAAEDERVKINAAIADIDTEIKRREDLARQECNGTSGRGLTGRVGEGPNCRQLRGETAEYIASSNRPQRQDELNAVNTKIADIGAQISTASQGYAEAVSKAIKEAVDAKEAALETPGLLDQVRALSQLADQNVFVQLQSWLLRLLLVVLDALPVITKRLSRPTTYDGLLSRQLTISDKLHHKTLKSRSDQALGDLDVQIQETEHNIRVRRERIEEQGRDAEADRQATLDAQIEELARRLRGDS
ncbi:DUF4407 domain-containing protein [Dactylosporangium sp. NPDC000521]|uniref:DUF4407 domain-containing protein n=1 Tax=Dactylosporangium sp. NPDC000521 TaxID=3363975 RepID=UPI0036AEB884